MFLTMNLSRQLSHRAIPALFAVLPGLLFAQGTTRTLSKPEVEFEEPFSRIAGFRELRDGRVIIADARDKVVQLLDLKAQTASKIGREGSGPGEYGLPTALVSLPGDTTFVFDPLNSRYMKILPDGKPGATFRLEDGAPPASAAPAGGAPGMRIMSGLNVPRATDAKGYLYFEGSPISFGPDGPVSADSAPVMRYDRKTYKYDTLSFVTLPKNNASVQSRSSGGNQNVSVRVGAASPFPARDLWTALPNGSVAIVRVKDYHVDVIGPNRQVTRGPAVPFTPVKIGEAEKVEYRQSQTSNAPIAIMRTNDNGRVSTNASTLPPAEEPKEWPATKPPFAGTVVAAPNGDIWVARSRPASDKIPKYDVFNAAGRLTGQVLLPKDTRLLGFGAGGAIYTVRSDEDDLQYLQRFRG